MTSAQAMAKMNKTMNLPAMQKIMMEFEKQSEMMEMKVLTYLETFCTHSPRFSTQAPRHESVSMEVRCDLFYARRARIGLPC
jgi:hypothetical protein